MTRNPEGVVPLAGDPYVELEDLLTLPAASRSLPGRPPVRALRSWAITGLVSRSGIRVRLRITQVSGRPVTSRAWLDAFLLAIADDPST